MSTTLFNRAVAWGLLAVAVLVNIAGWAFGLYDALWWFDKVLHLYGTFAYTLVLALFAYEEVLTGAREHKLLLILTIGAMGLS